MGEAVFDQEVPFKDAPHDMAAVIWRMPPGNLHVGLLYKRNGQVRVLHLAWDNDLQDEWTWERLWAVPEAEPEKLFLVGAWCQRILNRFRAQKRAKHESPLPYGFRFDQSRFTETGLRLGSKAIGLTCSTFVLAILNAVGVQLVDENSWPIRTTEDIAFLENLTVLQRPDMAKLKASLMSEVLEGCPRIRPEELVAACATAPPVMFVACEPESKRVLEKLPPLASPA